MRVNGKKYERTLQVLPVMLLFFLVSIIGIFHHEIWLDEAQHFLLARDSSSLSGLFTNMKYDGHVELWNYLLFFITHYISINPAGMQILHLVIINAAIFIFLRYAPFHILVKTAIVFGYYFLFEYSLVSRNYALGILLLFACCALAANRGKNMIWIGIFSFLMCNTHLFFLFAALALYFYFLYDCVKEKRMDYEFIVFTLLLLAGVSLSVLQMMQLPTDNTYFHPVATTFSAKTISHPFYSMVRGFFPVQDLGQVNFWNSYVFDSFGRLVKVVLAFAVLFSSFFLLRKDKKVLLFFVSCTGFLLLFLFLSQMHGNRYFGMFYIFFLAAVWLAGNEGHAIFSFRRSRKTRFVHAAVGFVLSCQVFAGLYAYTIDLLKPFSAASLTANFIRNNNLGKKMILVDGYGSGPSLSAYLGKPLYYLDIRKEGSYCIWRQSYFPAKRRSLQEEMTAAGFVQDLDEFILVSSRASSRKELVIAERQFDCKELARFTGNIIKPDYYLYHLIRRDQHAYSAATVEQARN